MRAIRAVRELNEDAAAPITVIALYTEPEHQAMFVREADEAYCLGPQHAVGGNGAGATNGYLDLGALERALVDTRADAAWVGWGFVAEHPGFVELCERLGVVFVGPDAARDAPARRQGRGEAAGREGGPPGGALERRPGRERRRGRSSRRERIGYPLMIKAVAGGGGRGIRRVDSTRGARRSASQRPRPRPATRSATTAVLLERLIEPARHVEVQVIADGQGTAWAAGVRDCSCQRRNQKVRRGVEQPGALARAGAASSARRRCGSRSRPATGARPRSSSSTSPRSDSSRSWRSTPASRWNTPSPRPSRGRTWSSSSSTSPPAAGSRVSRRQLMATRSRPGSTPRTRRSASPRRRGGSSCSAFPAGPGHPRRHRGSRRATRFPPNSTR